MLKGKKVLLGVSGGIAAYKAVDLASNLTKMGAQVKTILTASACELIKPLTFKSITHQSVSTKLFDVDHEIEHITLADWADIVVIAPATANLIGKTANAIADDLLSTTLLATTAPVLFVPAMNVHMYSNSIFQANIEKLLKHNYYFMEPDSGKLACGYEGKGRFPQTEEIIYHIKTYLNYSRDLTDFDFLITTGACRESIDPMRFITNHSSGKMGLALARAAHIRGAQVKVINGIVEEPIPEYIQAIETQTAEEMYQAVIAESAEHQIIIMAAAVSDYTPGKTASQKIKKETDLQLKLVRTKDILQELGKRKTDAQTLVGFAAESEELEQNARAKLEKKNLDMIIANDLSVAGKTETELLVLTEDRKTEIKATKFAAAHKLLDLICYEE